MTTEAKRLILLNKIIAGRSQKQFANDTGLNESYLSQLMTGRKKFGEKAAKNMEERLGLIPGVLQHPSDVNILKNTNVDSFYSALSSFSEPGVRPSLHKAPLKTEAKRIEILKAIIGLRSQVDFCDHYGLSAAHLSQLTHGKRVMGTRSAKNIEEKLGLIPGTLEHPLDIETESPQSILELFLEPFSVMPERPRSPGRQLLRNLEALIKQGALSDDHIHILDLTAGQFAKDRLENTKAGAATNE